MATTPKLTFDDVRVFFEEKAPKASSCSYCGARNWTVMYIAENEDPRDIATTYALPIAISTTEEEPLDLTQDVQNVALAGRSIIPISCRNCGGMRILDTRPLVLWKLEKLNESTEESSQADNDQADKGTP